VPHNIFNLNIKTTAHYEAKQFNTFKSQNIILQAWILVHILEVLVAKS